MSGAEIGLAIVLWTAAIAAWVFAFTAPSWRRCRHCGCDTWRCCMCGKGK